MQWFSESSSRFSLWFFVWLQQEVEHPYVWMCHGWERVSDDPVRSVGSDRPQGAREELKLREGFSLHTFMESSWGRRRKKSYKVGAVLNQIQSHGDKEGEERDEHGMPRSHPAWTQKSSMHDPRRASKFFCIYIAKREFFSLRVLFHKHPFLLCFLTLIHHTILTVTVKESLKLSLGTRWANFGKGICKISSSAIVRLL